MGRAWSAAPGPVLVVDGGGNLVEANRAARSLFSRQAGKDLTEGGLPHWLAQAHDSLRTTRTPPDTVSGAVADRTFAAHPSPGEGGNVVWWLVEDTDLRSARRALRSERERTALLADISGALLSSLNVDRCTEVTARMAADHLADAAVIVAPARGRRHSLTYAQAGGALTRTVAQIEPAAVPGLAEALQGFP
ncbi:serine/threonine protein phosphatase, partial [Streptomyces sp. ID05-04B]|nr:serine/threonine protein phosphatase [Streptomyces sp. ID05-04B]